MPAPQAGMHDGFAHKKIKLRIRGQRRKQELSSALLLSVSVMSAKPAINSKDVPIKEKYYLD